MTARRHIRLSAALQNAEIYFQELQGERGRDNSNWTDWLRPEPDDDD